MFAIQQLIEGVIWLTFSADAPLLNLVMTHVYSFFSHVLWPVCLPVAVLMIEPPGWYRRTPLLRLALVRSFFQAWPDTFRLDRTLALIGSTLLIQGVRDSLPLQDLAVRWQDGLDAFVTRRQRHLLY